MDFVNEKILLHKFELTGAITRNNKEYLVYKNKDNGERLELTCELYDWLMKIRNGYLEDICSSLNGKIKGID